MRVFRRLGGAVRFAYESPLGHVGAFHRDGRRLPHTVPDGHFSVPETNPYQPAASGLFVYCVWHDSIVVPVFAGRQPSTTALVGHHRDGSYVAQILKRVGIPSVRGSSSRHGAAALRGLLEQTENDHIVMTPDGPRGPRRQLKPGMAFIASRTGKPVVPTAFSCSRPWFIRGSWTDLMIPSPFSTVYALTGDPIAVSADADRDRIDLMTATIQQDMDRLNRRAELLATGSVVPATDRESDTMPERSGQLTS